MHSNGVAIATEAARETARMKSPATYVHRIHGLITVEALETSDQDAILVLDHHPHGRCRTHVVMDTHNPLHTKRAEIGVLMTFSKTRSLSQDEGGVSYAMTSVREGEEEARRTGKILLASAAATAHQSVRGNGNKKDHKCRQMAISVTTRTLSCAEETPCPAQRNQHRSLIPSHRIAPLHATQSTALSRLRRFVPHQDHR